MVFEEFHSSPVSHMEEPIATERSTSYRVEASLPITRELREQFLCPICYDTIENAHRVFPCLHYFCGSCIRRAFNTIQNVEDGKVKHHCPACRHVIPSKRHIIKDTNFDDMIRSLKCSREESTEDIDISAYRKNHQARVKDMKIYQAANKTRILSQPYIAPVSRTSLGDNVSASKKRGRQSKDHLSDPPTASHPEYSQSYLGSSVKFSMKYYNPQNPNDATLNAANNLTRPFVQARSTTTMLELKLLLCSYFSDQTENTIDLYSWNTKHATMIFMENDMTLHRYCVDIWNQTGSIVFFYSFKTSA